MSGDQGREDSTRRSADHDSGADRRDATTGRSVFREAGQFQSDLAATSIISYLITGPALYGGLGWLGDRFFGTSFLLPVGIVGGMALSIYLIWFRYGRT